MSELFPFAVVSIIPLGPVSCSPYLKHHLYFYDKKDEMDEMSPLAINNLERRFLYKHYYYYYYYYYLYIFSFPFLFPYPFVSFFLLNPVSFHLFFFFFFVLFTFLLLFFFIFTF